jgi:hypothetical protein
MATFITDYVARFQARHLGCSQARGANTVGSLTDIPQLIPT